MLPASESIFISSTKRRLVSCRTSIWFCAACSEYSAIAAIKPTMTSIAANPAPILVPIRICMNTPPKNSLQIY